MKAMENAIEKQRQEWCIMPKHRVLKNAPETEIKTQKRYLKKFKAIAYNYLDEVFLKLEEYLESVEERSLKNLSIEHKTFPQRSIIITKKGWMKLWVWLQNMGLECQKLYSTEKLKIVAYGQQKILTLRAIWMVDQEFLQYFFDQIETNCTNFKSKMKVLFSNCSKKKLNAIGNEILILTLFKIEELREEMSKNIQKFTCLPSEFKSDQSFEIMNYLKYYHFLLTNLINNASNEICNKFNEGQLLCDKILNKVKEKKIEIILQRSDKSKLILN